MGRLGKNCDVNCKGTMYGIGAVLPQMASRRQGHIINITSDAGKAFAGLGELVQVFVEGVASTTPETANTGVRVTCIQPTVSTPLLATSTDTEGKCVWGAQWS